MAKNRYLNTKFWRDNYIQDLDPSEKLLFIYCLTNPDTNITGIYEIPLKIIATDTGLDKDMLIKIFKRFEDEKKIKYYKGWIAIKNFIKHQALNNKIKTGIENELNNVPAELVEWLDIDFESLSIDYTYPLNYSNTNLNKNKNKNIIVHLLFSELKFLITTYGKDNTRNIINKLSTYKTAHGKKYKSDFAAVQSWVIEALKLKPIEKADPAKKREMKINAYIEKHGISPEKAVSEMKQEGLL